MKYDIDFYTQYNQFYLCDKDYSEYANSRDFWTDEAFEDRLAVEKGTLGIRTECYGPVKGEFIILKEENQSVDLDSYDHVVEGEIQVQSGIVQIVDCPNSEVECEVKLEPGMYRVRVYSSNLATVDGDEGDDFYTIEIWPSNIKGRNVLKRY